MNYINLISKFLSEVIINNKIKILFVILSIICFKYVDEIPDSQKELFIIKSVDLGDLYKNRYAYIYESSISNEIKVEVISFEKPQELVNNKIIYTAYNELNIPIWILFVVFTLLYVIPSFMYDDDDVSWELKDIWYDSLKSTIYSELEDGVYYYMSFGRLIHKSEKLLTPENVMRISGINSFSDIKSMPKFKTKSLKRESILKEIGI
jgi:hypothetical protein